MDRRNSLFASSGAAAGSFLAPGFAEADDTAPASGLAPQAKDPAPGIRAAIEKRFGSLEKWSADFIASAKAAAGWAMLVSHPVNGRLYNVVSDEHAQGPLQLAAPLIVIDTYEHAFYIDYQNK
jgi:superoxide dismutase